MRFSRQVLMGLAVVAIVAVSGLAAGINIIYHPSQPVSGTVRAGVENVFTSLVLTPNDIEEGQSWTLSGELSNKQAGRLITLKEGDTVVGTVWTVDQGKFSYTFKPSFAGPDDEVKTYVAYT